MELPLIVTGLMVFWLFWQHMKIRHLESRCSYLEHLIGSDVLKRARGEDLPDDPDDWWKRGVKEEED